MAGGSRSTPPLSSKPAAFEDRYRLYLDESGDHVFRDFSTLSHRFLCLLGCWFQNPDYLRFHRDLEKVKARHLPHHPDDPVVLHRDDILNARRSFSWLRDAARRKVFDDDLLRAVAVADFRIVAVVVDKQELRAAYGEAAAHPYHLALGFLLQRYAGYLNHVNRRGDVMAESRGGAEDRLLKESYTRVFERGVWMTEAHAFQSALTSRQLKLKQKAANNSGLQLADILGHPIKQWVLRRYGLLSDPPPPFAERILEAVKSKLNCHLYKGTSEGYGYVLFPKK